MKPLKKFYVRFNGFLGVKARVVTVAQATLERIDWKIMEVYFYNFMVISLTFKPAFSSSNIWAPIIRQRPVVIYHER